MDLVLLMFNVCLDDTLLYEDNIEKSFQQVAAYLSLVGQNGIILNPDKFEFAED